MRNVTVLLLLRGLVVAGGMASAMLVPRTMGPATYGRFDLVTTMTFLFSMLGGLGIGQVMSRQAPELLASGRMARLRALFGNLFVLRAASGLVVGLLYVLVMRLWLRDLDGTILVLLSVAILLRVPGSLCYALFLGQGRIARWALPELVRQWGSIAFALPCFLWGGLPAAIGGYLVSELVIFTIGLLGARGVVARAALRFESGAVRPLLRVGLAFFATDLVLAAVERSGTVMVRAITHDYARVGMFGVSYQTFMAAVLCSHQLAQSFVPLLTVLRTRGRAAELRLWVERLVKWLSVAAVLGLLGAVTVGREIVPLVFGRAFAPAYPSLLLLAGTLLFLPLTQVCSVLALTHDRPSVVFRAAALRLLVFWALGLPLVIRWSDLGACVAVGLGIVAQTAYLVGLKWSVVRPAFRRWLLVVAAGLLFVPVAGLRGSFPRDTALFVVAAAGFLLVLRGTGLISARELRAVYWHLSFRRVRPRGGQGT